MTKEVTVTLDRRTMKALKLAIRELNIRRGKHVIYVAMAVHGFEEGVRGKKKWEEYDDALKVLCEIAGVEYSQSRMKV